MAFVGLLGYLYFKPPRDSRSEQPVAATQGGTSTDPLALPGGAGAEHGPVSKSPPSARYWLWQRRPSLVDCVVLWLLLTAYVWYLAFPARKSSQPATCSDAFRPTPLQRALHPHASSAPTPSTPTPPQHALHPHASLTHPPPSHLPNTPSTLTPLQPTPALAPPRRALHPHASQHTLRPHASPTRPPTSRLPNTPSTLTPLRHALHPHASRTRHPFHTPVTATR